MSCSSNVGVTIYSALMGTLFRLARALSVVDRRIERFARNRAVSKEQLRNLQEAASRAHKRMIFFCSSAGEYEQTRPVVDQLNKEPDTFVVVIFFSESGVEFAKSKGDTIVYLKAPIDAIWNWEPVFNAVLPQVTVIVRHEIWPAFVHVAKRFGKLVLINYSATGNLRWRSFKQKMLQRFDEIYAVSSEDAAFLTSTMGISGSQIFCLGDTKYDRARDRAIQAHRNSAQLSALFSQSRQKRRLVLGSGWQKDIEYILSVFAQEPQLLNNWQVIVVPHDTSADMIRWIVEKCRKQSLTCATIKGLETSDLTVEAPQVLIVDKVGILAELYGLCDLAMVGGALHHRVHNVLEPASHGLPICFGPLFETSSEAKELVDSRLAAVIRSEKDLASWWLNEKDVASKRSEMVQYVSARCGATNEICKRLKRLTGEDGKK
jgi:3-deoxy-D-manno-octulosonic-acid transferase